jgi:hypothetical protein
MSGQVQPAAPVFAVYHSLDYGFSKAIVITYLVKPRLGRVGPFPYILLNSHGKTYREVQTVAFQRADLLGFFEYLAHMQRRFDEEISNLMDPKIVCPFYSMR